MSDVTAGGSPPGRWLTMLFVALRRLTSLAFVYAWYGVGCWLLTHLSRWGFWYLTPPWRVVPLWRDPSLDRAALKRAAVHARALQWAPPKPEFDPGVGLADAALWAAVLLASGLVLGWLLFSLAHLRAVLRGFLRTFFAAHLYATIPALFILYFMRSEYRYWAVGAIMALVYLGLLFMSHERRLVGRPARRRPGCPECGYSLRRVTTNTCPECGVPYVGPRRHFRRWAAPRLALDKRRESIFTWASGRTSLRVLLTPGEAGARVAIPDRWPTAIGWAGGSMAALVLVWVFGWPLVRLLANLTVAGTIATAPQPPPAMKRSIQAIANPAGLACPPIRGPRRATVTVPTASEAGLDLAEPRSLYTDLCARVPNASVWMMFLILVHMSAIVPVLLAPIPQLARRTLLKWSCYATAAFALAIPVAILRWIACSLYLNDSSFQRLERLVAPDVGFYTLVGVGIVYSIIFALGAGRNRYLRRRGWRVSAGMLSAHWITWLLFVWFLFPLGDLKRLLYL